MAFNFRLTSTFERNKNGITEDVLARAVEKMKEILNNPYCGVPLTGNLKGLWKMRIGKYRILYEISEEEK